VGGMATVYEATHEILGTRVAIKVLHPILSNNAQLKERFMNEARLMASLNHPNITKIIDFDEQPNQLSIIMEYLEGEDLNKKIKRQGGLDSEEIKHIFTQTLAACQFAHDQGILHRDIKPSNMFVLTDGTLKMLDFGIAKIFGQANDMTQTGTQMGTPIYMSPEQVKADKTIDYRSDIYSLGVSMYYAINGKPPYQTDKESQFEIFNKIVFEPLPAFQENSPFADQVHKACQKDREERFQSCSEWLTVLSEGRMVPVVPTEKKEVQKKVVQVDNDDRTTIVTPNEPQGKESVEQATLLTSAIQATLLTSAIPVPKGEKVLYTVLRCLMIIYPFLVIFLTWFVFDFETQETYMLVSGIFFVCYPMLIVLLERASKELTGTVKLTKLIYWYSFIILIIQIYVVLDVKVLGFNINGSAELIKIISFPYPLFIIITYIIQIRRIWSRPTSSVTVK